MCLLARPSAITRPAAGIQAHDGNRGVLQAAGVCRVHTYPSIHPPRHIQAHLGIAVARTCSTHPRRFLGVRFGHGCSRHCTKIQQIHAAGTHYAAQYQSKKISALGRLASGMAWLWFIDSSPFFPATPPAGARCRAPFHALNSRIMLNECNHPLPSQVTRPSTSPAPRTLSRPVRIAAMRAHAPLAILLAVLLGMCSAPAPVVAQGKKSIDWFLGGGLYGALYHCVGCQSSDGALHARTPPAVCRVHYRSLGNAYGKHAACILQLAASASRHVQCLLQSLNPHPYHP